jgi:hypothetical protein
VHEFVPNRNASVQECDARIPNSIPPGTAPKKIASFNKMMAMVKLLNFARYDTGKIKRYEEPYCGAEEVSLTSGTASIKLMKTNNSLFPPAFGTTTSVRLKS